MKTPDWILEGYDSKADWEKAHGIKKEAKGKTFKIKVCPKCGSEDVHLVLSNSDAEEGGGKEWECKKCGWKGENIAEKELTEDEFMKYLDDPKKSKIFGATEFTNEKNSVGKGEKVA